MFVRSVLFVALLSAVVTNASPGEKSKKYCDETHVRASGRVRRNTEAKQDEFPHMVSLSFEYDDTVFWRCTGSLISNKYVLTTATCLTFDLHDKKFAKLGTVDLDSNIEPSKISKVITHPDYKHPSHYNNIGLVELEKPVEFNDSIRPACLNTDDSDDQKHTLFIATGWGETSFIANPSSKLLKVALEEVSNDNCKKLYPSNSKIVESIRKESQLCARGGDKDTCTLDSGGPLQILNTDYVSTYDIHGVNSFGLGCGANDTAVYTRVSHYVDWIESIVF